MLELGDWTGMMSSYCSLSRALEDLAHQLQAHMTTPFKTVPLYSEPVLFLRVRVRAQEHGQSLLVKLT